MCYTTTHTKVQKGKRGITHHVGRTRFCHLSFIFFNKTNIKLSRSLVELQFNEFELICFKQFLPSWSQVSHWSQAKSYLKLLSVSINGILEIPLMRISQSSEILFRNSQTFERLYCGGSRYTRQPVIVMTYLVNTARDVGLLC